MENKFILVIIAILVPSVYNCGTNTSPKTYEDCKSGSTNLQYCCFIRSPGFDPIIKKCAPYDKSKYHGQKEYVEMEDLGANIYRMDCGDIEFLKEKGKLCGNDVIKNPADCWAFSTPKHSCCSTFTRDKCIWYKKKQGNITDDDSIEALICLSNTIQMKRIRIVIVFIMFIFI